MHQYNLSCHSLSHCGQTSISGSECIIHYMVTHCVTVWCNLKNHYPGHSMTYILSCHSVGHSMTCTSWSSTWSQCGVNCKIIHWVTLAVTYITLSPNEAYCDTHCDSLGVSESACYIATNWVGATMLISHSAGHSVTYIPPGHNVCCHSSDQVGS